MKKLLISMPLVAAGLAAFVFIGWAGGQSQAAAGPRVASVLGVAEVQGEKVFAHISVLVPPGLDERTVADEALSAQGARRASESDLEPAEYATTGLVWDQFSDGNPGNDFVDQYYNPSKDPSGIDGAALLQNTQATWTNVPTSSFAFAYGGTTARCPSLVNECSGAQQFDGFNDVTFLSLAGPCNAARGCTLGVTWSGTSIDEADMALNAKANWNAGCVDVNGRFDTETVILHENGHVVGLGHSDDPSAIMFASYSGAQCDLSQDDLDGVSFLYPADGGTPQPTATPANTPMPTNTPAPTATPTPGGEPTPTDEPFCPRGWARRGLC